MTQALDTSLIRILNAAGKPVGAGFLVAERLALTCAHVVSAARPNTDATDVTFDFPLLPNHPRLIARITHWDETADIAGLELIGALPGEVAPVRLANGLDLWGHPFRAFGFPRGYDHGVWASGQLQAQTANGWLQFKDTDITGYIVQPGFSGGPLWDETLSAVVGMVVAADSPTIRAAFGIPVAALLTAWPALAEAATFAEPQPANELRTYYPTSVNQPAVRPTGSGRRRIFLSYKRGAQPDEALALHLYAALSAQHDVFIDQGMTVGTAWRDRIQAELEVCDFLIPLLSEQSAHSEMVAYEISLAHHLGQSRGGQPAILPVRVDYTEAFDYPLSAYLNHLNWAVWRSEADNAPLVRELLAAISGGQLALADVLSKAALLQARPVDAPPRPTPAANPARLERPDGTMDPESQFYIERPGDNICQRELQYSGATIVIKAPRQMGKSSLLVRAAEHARRAGRSMAFLDFQLLDETILTDPTRFFKGFCHWIADELDLDDTVESFWQSGLGNVQLCSKYIQRHVLNAITCPLVLAMDEVDRLLNCPFRSDFFGMLRSWHNTRRSGNEWNRLDLLLVISTEPYLLIDDLKQSPFNVGIEVRLDDFSLEQVVDLNQRHGAPFSLARLQQLDVLLGGHPYLVRQALYRVACGEIGADNLLKHATADDGPFGDHLRRLLAHLGERQNLLRAMHQVVIHQTCVDNDLFNRLHRAGLVRQDGKRVFPRCELYAIYFQEHFKNV